MFLTIPAALGLILLREPVTALLLQHGAFRPEDTHATALALGFFCLGLIPQAGIEIHSRGFYAIGDTRTPVIFAVVAVGLNLVLSAILFGPFETSGLALAVSLAAWLEWGLLYWVYLGRTGASAAADLDAGARYLFCAAAMMLGLALGFITYDADSVVDHAVQALFGGAAGLLLYLGMAMWLRVPELDGALGRVRAILGLR